MNGIEVYLVAVCMHGPVGCQQFRDTYIGTNVELQQAKRTVERYIEVYAGNYADVGAFIGLFASQSLQFRYHNTNIQLRPSLLGLQWSF